MTWARRGVAGIAFLIAAFPATAQQQKALTEQELKAKGARQMTGAEIKASRSGNTWYYFHLVHSATLPVYYRDERNRIAVFGGTKRQTLWWIEGDKGCDEAVTFVGHTCGKLYVLNNQMHFCADGRPICESIIRQLPGNPENL